MKFDVKHIFTFQLYTPNCNYHHLLYYFLFLLCDVFYFYFSICSVYSKLTVNCLSLISFESKIRKKYINFQVRGHFAHKCKTSGGICKTSCLLTEEFDGGGKLTNVVQFQGIIEVLLILEG